MPLSIGTGRGGGGGGGGGGGNNVPLPPPLLFLSSLLLLLLSSHVAALQSSRSGVFVDVENPVVDVKPIRLGSAFNDVGALCERVLLSGLSRFKLKSYSSAHRITLVPSVTIPERLHHKIQICFHKNSSLGHCQCQKDDWRALHNGVWSVIVSPYEDRYIDVKFVSDLSGSVTVTVDVEFQRWRLLCLALGFIMLLLAPLVSDWVPFYYSSSMAIGICLVIIILLFQGMKLLPTGRKNIFYLTIYGSVLGAGSFLVHQFSMLVNSVLVNLGLSEELHNPVSIFLLVGIVLAGAGLGYWLVRKFVVSEDGSVDVGVAQFVKWAIRVVSLTFIFQSTMDTPLALAALGSCLAVCSLASSMTGSYPEIGNPWAHNTGRTNTKRRRAEFLSRSGKIGSGRKLWNSPKSSFAWSNSPVRGVMSPPPRRGTMDQRDYYSAFHKNPDRKKFSKREWEDFTEESTRQAVADLTSSPEFTDWIIKHADRIQLRPDDSSEETIGSGSDSTDENVVESRSGLGFFKWQRQM